MSTKKILRPDFFNRETPVVAEELLGKFLVRHVKGGPHAASKTIALMITETEAYHGFDDRASHVYPARSGSGPRQTPRNTPMFGSAGTIYVYFTYGMHWMLNIVCGKKEFPAAVLIRGAGDISGPAKLTKFLQIDKKLNAQKLGKASGLWIEDRGVKILPRQIKKTPRVGIAYAGEWVQKPWRFVLKPLSCGMLAPGSSLHSASLQSHRCTH